MSQVISSFGAVPAFPGEAPRTRRAGSPGRRFEDQRKARVGATPVPVDEAETIPAQRDRMIAVFGHDLRGLLNLLAVHTEIFLRQDGDAAADGARNIRLSIARMDRMIASLLDYVRLNADKLGVTPRPLDAAELLREAVEVFRPLARVKSLSLILSVPDRPLPATADPDRMFQVLSNLLSNAIKFSSVNGEVRVRATTSGHDIRIEVLDDGPGIPEGDLERVFDCFCQLEQSDSGLGLGLYIARAIIQAHGGRIWATSQPGAGSVFTFTIPRARA